ncbi:MAG: dihydrofolate reductase family protein [Chloroflexi bacterium]|nr:dihydrofolate reductase family protein [Chloroflexota bacterium]
MNAPTRPFVTLSFAQSLDGSIAAEPGKPLRLSCPEAMTRTHELRASHDAILVGIGTVLADDPQLTVRLAPGKSPRPIILDSTLRCPTRARCVDATRRTIIATTDAASREREHALVAAGAVVWRFSGARVNLDALLARLNDEGIASLMVEGGARVIASFLRARLVDRVVITIAPVLVGGVRAVPELIAHGELFPRLRDAEMQQVGTDWIVSGTVEWN